MDPLATRVASRIVEAASYLQVNDIVLYGKYKNHHGKIIGFSTDKWGNPTILIDPIPKGRKKTVELGLYRVWRADVKEKALKEQAKALQEKTAACQCGSSQKIHDFAHLFAEGLSDLQIIQKMNITYEESQALARELRQNFGIGPEQSLRDAIRKRHAGLNAYLGSQEMSYMYDRRTAAFQFNHLPGNHLSLNPAGTWSFVGSVDGRLVYLRADGRELTESQRIGKSSTQLVNTALDWLG